MTKEQIYEYMTVQFNIPVPIECEFDEGKPCEALYSKVCDARIRLSERTGIDFEDHDVMAIIENLEEIAKICALKMYDYGVAQGQQEA